MADLTNFPQTRTNTGAPGAFLADNNYKTKPLSNYSTRVLEFFRIEVAGVDVDTEVSNSTFTKVVRGVQTISQIAVVGKPASGAVVIAVEGDTTPDSGPAFSNDSTPTKAERMQAAVAASVGAAATVTSLSLIGGTLA